MRATVTVVTVTKIVTTSLGQQGPESVFLVHFPLPAIMIPPCIDRGQPHTTWIRRASRSILVRTFFISQTVTDYMHYDDI